jgi:hydrogenase maturation protease
MNRERRLLIAGMGNVLCGDDGFGVAVAQELMRRAPLRGMEVIEVGIGGMHVVQALMDGYQALVIVDAVERGAPPGTLFVLDPDIAPLDSLPPEEAHAIAAATHHTVPARVLMLARALGVLPPKVAIVGCQPACTEQLGTALSPAVHEAVDRAVARIERLARELLEDPHAAPC